MRVAALTVALFLTSLAPAAALACTLFRVDAPEHAQLRVYFTRFESEDETDGRYRDCEVVDVPEDDSVRFWITRFRQDANLIVHPSNWPRD
jgi:hypothetical protein